MGLGVTDFMLPPGQVVFGVTGPGVIVENGAQVYRVDCGDPASPDSCQGAVPLAASAAGPAAGPAVTGAAAFTVHVALRPNVQLPLPVATSPIVLTAVYRPIGSEDQAMESTRIGLAVPAYRLGVSPDRMMSNSGTVAGVVIEAHLQRRLRGSCTNLGDGVYVVCGDSISSGFAAGGEQGELTFTTDLGTFVNQEQSVTVPCGGGSDGSTTLVIPTAGSESPFRLDCDTVRVRLLTLLSAGEAHISAQFTGAVTSATAAAQTTVTIAPRPVTGTLTLGCAERQAPSALPRGAPVSLLVESLNPAEAVVGIWRRNSQTGGLDAGYFRDSAAPLDFGSIDPGDRIIICVDAQAQYPLN